MIILFDLDGTLIDSTEAILESFHHSFKVNGLEYRDDEKICSLVGYPLDVMFSELGVDESMMDDCIASYKMHYREISNQKTILLDGAREAIELAGSFAKLGVVTTKTARYSKELLEFFGVMDSFEVLIGREDVANPKPDAEPILKALEHFNEEDSKDGVFMIGDTKMDLLSAKNASVESIAVLSGYGTRESLERYTTNIFDTTLDAIKELMEL